MWSALWQSAGTAPSETIIRRIIHPVTAVSPAAPSPTPPPSFLPPPRRTLTLSQGGCDEARLSPSHTHTRTQTHSSPGCSGITHFNDAFSDGAIPGGSSHCTRIKAAALALPLVNFFIFLPAALSKKKSKIKNSTGPSRCRSFEVSSLL